MTAPERSGPVGRRPDPGYHQVQVVRLTAAGRRIQAQVTESRRAAFGERLADRPEEDPAPVRRGSGALQRVVRFPGGAARSAVTGLAPRRPRTPRTVEHGNT